MSETPTHGIVHHSSRTFDDDRPTLYDVFPSEEAARGRLPDVQEEYPGAEVMTLSEYEEANRDWHLDEPVSGLTFCTEEKYYEMRDVLPPRYYQSGPQFGRFCMKERQSGTVTRQYVRLETESRALFAWRNVDLEDRSTWITREEMEQAAKARPETYTHPDASAASGKETRSQFGSHA